MPNFTNNTGAPLRVRGEVVEPGKSVEVKGDKLPGSLELISEGAKAAKADAPAEATGGTTEGRRAPEPAPTKTEAKSAPDAPRKG